MASLSPKTLREMATLLGYDWSDEEIARISPQVERALALVDRLDSLPLRDTEPGILFHMV